MTTNTQDSNPVKWDLFYSDKYTVSLLKNGAIKVDNHGSVTVMPSLDNLIDAALSHERQRNDGDAFSYVLLNSKGTIVSWSVSKEVLESDIKTYYKDQGYTIRELFTSPQQAIPAVFVNVSHMKESNGNQWWTVNLSRSVDDKPWDGIGVYTDTIEGRALYEAARLRHFFGQCDNPCILDFDTDAPKSAAPTAPIASQVREALESQIKELEQGLRTMQLAKGDYGIGLAMTVIEDAIVKIRALIQPVNEVK